MSLDPPEYKEGEYAICKRDYEDVFLDGEKYKVSPLIWNGVHYAYNVYVIERHSVQFHLDVFYKHFFGKNELRKKKLNQLK